MGTLRNDGKKADDKRADLKRTEPPHDIRKVLRRAPAHQYRDSDTSNLARFCKPLVGHSRNVLILTAFDCWMR